MKNGRGLIRMDLAHSYQYSFEPNPHWSGFYAGAEEICEHLQRTARKYGVDRSVKLKHKVVRCEWREEDKKWYVAKNCKADQRIFLNDTTGTSLLRRPPLARPLRRQQIL